MDETGHSKDERQKFVGVAGLMAPAESWAVFERKWKQALNDFKIPYFHMRACLRAAGDGRVCASEFGVRQRPFRHDRTRRAGNGALLPSLSLTGLLRFSSGDATT